MSPKYAAGTEVPVENSRAEIERILSRYGATAFAYGWNAGGAMIEFAACDRRVRFVLPLPDRADAAFTTYTRGTQIRTSYRRSPEEATKRWEQACRQRWRALVLVVKAKLEAVDAGISEFEAEFLAHVVLPDGRTVGEHIGPAIALAYDTGEVPALLALPERT